MSDYEKTTLTPEGESMMTRFLCSKKAASLVDKFKVSACLSLLVGDDEDKEFKRSCEEMLTSSHEDLIRYISELESIKAQS